MSEQFPERIPFIPAWLDCLGLTAPVFRVYCSLWSRSNAERKCWPSAELLARDCRLNKKTVWEAVKFLIESGRISKTGRFRNSNIYLMNPTQHLTQKRTASERNKKSLTQTEPHQSDPNEVLGSDPNEVPERYLHEGTPLKVSPKGAPPPGPPVIAEEEETFDVPTDGEAGAILRWRHSQKHPKDPSYPWNDKVFTYSDLVAHCERKSAGVPLGPPAPMPKGATGTAKAADSDDDIPW